MNERVIRKICYSRKVAAIENHTVRSKVQQRKNQNYLLSFEEEYLHDKVPRQNLL